MVPYFRSLKDDNNIIYSIDMIKIKGTLTTSNKRTLETYLSRKSELMGWKEPKINTCPLRYHYMMQLVYDTDIHFNSKSSIQLFIGLNDFNGRINNDIILVFNPNKVCDSKYNGNSFEALKDLTFFMKHISNACVVQFDLAIDIPTHRQNVTTQACFGRAYSRVNGDNTIITETGIAVVDAEDYTQYVGKHQTHGFLKIYNKRVESKLDYDLTRVEYTIICSEHRQDYRYSKVLYKLNDYDLGCNEITENELYQNFYRLACRLQVQSEILEMFSSRKIKAKLKDVMLNQYQELDWVHSVQFNSLYANLYAYCLPDTYLKNKKDKYYDFEIYYRLLKRKQYLKKHIVRDGRKWVPIADLNYDDILNMSDDSFNKAVKYGYKLYQLDYSSVCPFKFVSSKDTLETGLVSEYGFDMQDTAYRNAYTSYIFSNNLIDDDMVNYFMSTFGNVYKMYYSYMDNNSIYELAVVFHQFFIDNDIYKLHTGDIA